MYRHILISTDGSEMARKGVDHGLDLARAIGAKVTVVTVTEIVMTYMSEGTEAGGLSYYHQIVDIQRAAAQNLLAEVEGRAREMGVDVETVCVEQDSAAEAIVETAEQRNCDVIVIASHGRRGLTRVMLGSVAWKVLTLSSIPVLVVR